MKKFLFILMVFGIIAVIAAYAVISLSLIGDQGIEIKIRKGDTWEMVDKQFTENKQVKFPVLIKLTARILQYDQRIRSGRYVFEKGSSAFDIVRKLRSGNQDAVNFVINNITFKEQLASRVTQKLDIDSTDFLQFIENKENAYKYGFDEENFIAMFLCNSYQLYWDIGLENFVERMYQEYQRFWNDERKQKAQSKDLSSEDVIVLASIVQKETNHQPEYGTIASVYLNRIKLGMPLQADPTVKYALKDMAIKRILKKDLETDSPYNTYKYKGLPPGPIGLPESNVIDGVLNAPTNNYLYFCAIFGSGKHAFSTTYTEHLAYARAYQKALNEQKIFR